MMIDDRLHDVRLCIRPTKPTPDDDDDDDDHRDGARGIITYGSYSVHLGFQVQSEQQLAGSN